MGLPSMYTSPWVGHSKPAIMRRDVVFPQPEEPSMEKNSPFLICMVTWSTALSRLPSGVTNCFTTSRNSTANSFAIYLLLEAGFFDFIQVLCHCKQFASLR